MRYRISYLMDEIWERAVETALDGQTDHASVRNLTLDGAVKCLHGRLPHPSIFEKFQNLLHLSIANIGVSTLEQFPRLTNLQKLVLSDNRISSGLEFLVDAGLDSLRDLDLSNNRIQLIEDLAPLAQLRILSLDLYECPVTRVKDYRAMVFGLIKSLRYLDKMDVEGIERPESDDDEEDDEEEEEEEDDPGSGEIDGEDHPIVNGHGGERDEVVEVDVDEESDADEEETEISRNGLDVNHQVNGFHVVGVQDEEDDDDDDGEYEEEGNDSGEEEIDEEDGEDVNVVEVHEIDDSDENVVAEDEDGDDSEEEVDNEDGDFAEPESTGRLTSAEGEIDGHEQGEDEEDDNGETGEEELALDDDDEEEVEQEDEEDFGGDYLVQPIVHAEEEADGSDMDPGNEEDDLEEDLDEEDDLVEDDDPLGAIELQQSPSSHLKRKRGENVSDDDIDIDDDSGSDEDGDGEDDDDDDDDDDGDNDDDVL